MKTARVIGVVALAVTMIGLGVQDARACRVIPTPMPIVRPPRPRPRPKRKPLETRRHTADIEINGPVARVTVDAVF
ncbi:MAG: hypothetical protein ACODAJ_12310, partial [Planctomycetota bacterium]